QRGLDDPIRYVRWTERRNMAELLRLLAERRVDVSDLITHRFPIEEADRALGVVADGNSRSLAVMIEYSAAAAPESEAPPRRPETRRFVPGNAVGFIGAGSFARRELIPL